MKNIFYIAPFFISILLMSSCGVGGSLVINNADINSSLQEISAHKNSKAEIAARLTEKIGSMRLYKVHDYGKKYILDQDPGYGFHYVLRGGRRGAASIYLYKRYPNNVIDDGISDKLIEEIRTELSDYSNNKNTDNTDFTTVSFSGVAFCKAEIKTAPDRYNEQHICTILMTGHNGVYIKVMFYFPSDADYSDQEIKLFMNSLITRIKGNKEV